MRPRSVCTAYLCLRCRGRQAMQDLLLSRERRLASVEAIVHTRLKALAEWASAGCRYPLGTC
eukprot:3576851-Rhodomonas_salina.1